MKLLKKIILRYFQSLAYFYRYLRYRVIVVLILGLLVGFLDGLGLSMFLPLLHLVDDSQEPNHDQLGNLSVITETLQRFNLPLTLTVVLGLLFMFFLLKAIASYASQYFKIVVKQYFIKLLRIRLISSLSQYPYERFVEYKVGEIQNNLHLEIYKVSNAYVNYFTCIQSVFMVMIYSIFALLIDWKFAMLIIFGGLVTHLIYRNFYQKTKQASRTLTQNESRYVGYLTEYLSYYKYLKAVGRIQFFTKKINSAIQEIEHINKRISVLGIKISSSREPILIGIVCLVIIIQVYVIHGSLGTVLVSLLFFYRALTSLMIVQSSYNSFLGLSGSLENITQFENQLTQAKEKKGLIPIETIRHGIEFNQVSFAYEKEHNILDHIQLTIPANQTVALVGDSGSGKSTIVNLICGLFHPRNGEVTIDGISIRDLNLDIYRNKIGYIIQDPIIFNDTLFNNVSFWEDPSEENLQRFRQVMKNVLLEDFVDRLKDGHQTVLGGHGVTLSGGQKQRISIARELYKSVEILILDEATSALDAENEKLLQENLEELQGKITMIVIAHKLATIRNADTIFLLEAGKLKDQGSFDSLLVSSPKFNLMAQIQGINT
ncbi:MAG: ABC transporter ATP-binding protein [Flavobacterium sp.]